MHWIRIICLQRVKNSLQGFTFLPAENIEKLWSVWDISSLQIATKSSMSFPRTLLHFWSKVTELSSQALTQICWDAAPEPTQEAKPLGTGSEADLPTQGVCAPHHCWPRGGQSRWVLSCQPLRHPSSLASIFLRLNEDRVGENATYKALV